MGKEVKKVLGVIEWIAGILVSLAVGFGMITKILTVPYVPFIVTIIAGWIVVVTTIISAIFVMLKQ